MKKCPTHPGFRQSLSDPSLEESGSLSTDSLLHCAESETAGRTESRQKQGTFRGGCNSSGLCSAASQAGSAEADHPCSHLPIQRIGVSQLHTSGALVLRYK